MFFHAVGTLQPTGDTTPTPVTTTRRRGTSADSSRLSWLTLWCCVRVAKHLAAVAFKAVLILSVGLFIQQSQSSYIHSKPAQLNHNLQKYEIHQLMTKYHSRYVWICFKRSMTVVCLPHTRELFTIYRQKCSLVVILSLSKQQLHVRSKRQFDSCATHANAIQQRVLRQRFILAETKSYCSESRSQYIPEQRNVELIRQKAYFEEYFCSPKKLKVTPSNNK